MVEQDRVMDQIEGRRAVQETEEDWSAVIEGNKEIIKGRYDGSLSRMTGSTGQLSWFEQVMLI